jgi:hypothetical protein
LPGQFPEFASEFRVSVTANRLRYLRRSLADRAEETIRPVLRAALGTRAPQHNTIDSRQKRSNSASARNSSSVWSMAMTMISDLRPAFPVECDRDGLLGERRRHRLQLAHPPRSQPKARHAVSRGRRQHKRLRTGGAVRNDWQQRHGAQLTAGLVRFGDRLR